MPHPQFWYGNLGSRNNTKDWVKIKPIKTHRVISSSGWTTKKNQSRLIILFSEVMGSA